MVALIFGITGQAGSYLAEFLLSKGYTVHGVKRRSSSINTERVDHIYEDPQKKDRKFIMHYGDLSDATSIVRVIQKTQPDEIYNLAAQSHVQVSFQIPEYTCDVTGMGAVRILEAIRLLGSKAKYLQASSSEMFGKVQEVPQTENTPFYPRSPYGVAKVFAYWITKNYREAFGFFACNAICFNMESPRRGETFVTRKITIGIANILAGKQDCIYLGNLAAQRDWGSGKEYAEAMWMMMQKEKSDDYVVSTGVTTTIRDFAIMAFSEVGMDLKFYGSGADEVGKVGDKIMIRIDPVYFRPAEVDLLIGDSNKAAKELGWKPKKTLRDIVSEMVKSDIEQAR